MNGSRACLGFHAEVIRDGWSRRSKAALLALLALLLLAVSCGKYATDHPDYGKIIALTPDWSLRGEGVDVPAGFTVEVGDYTATLPGTTGSVDNLFTPGNYFMRVYNPASGITVKDGVATADYTAGNPDWFFTGTDSLRIDKDRDYSLAVAMRQQVRSLTLEIEVTGAAADRLASIDATLSGVAGAWRVDTDRPSGIGVTDAFRFAPATGGYWATVRLLGITGDEQTLSLTLHFVDNNPVPCTVVSDLSSRLAPFNDDKRTPMALSSILAVTPEQGSLSTTISDWALGANIEGIAE